MSKAKVKGKDQPLSSRFLSTALVKKERVMTEKEHTVSKQTTDGLLTNYSQVINIASVKI